MPPGPTRENFVNTRLAGTETRKTSSYVRQVLQSAQKTTDSR